MNDEPGLVSKKIAKRVRVSNEELNATALALRGVNQTINAEAADFFAAYSHTVLTAGNFGDADVEEEPNLALLDTVQNIRLRLCLCLLRKGPFKGYLSLMKKALLKLQASPGLKRVSFAILIARVVGQPKLDVWQDHVEAKLTECRARVTKDGDIKGMSATQVELEFGLAAVEMLRKLQASGWKFEETE